MKKKKFSNDELRAWLIGGIAKGHTLSGLIEALLNNGLEKEAKKLRRIYEKLSKTNKRGLKRRKPTL